jgi:protease I
MSKKILIPIPRKDFDPTEVAVPWKILSNHGHQIIFATPNGESALCDLVMLTGQGLGILAPILQADANGRAAYHEMIQSEAFKKPVNWEDLRVENYDGLILPGGHDKGMREYLESQVLQKLVVEFFEQKKPVGAICHGVVLAARSQSKDGKSILFGRKTTALLAQQELLAWGLTCLWMKDYYRTYPMTVESEVRACLATNGDFISGPAPLFRDSPENIKSGFVVIDGNYISARWPGDAHAFGHRFLELLK